MTYRIGQAAELLAVSVDTVRRWVDSGRLTATKDGNGRRLIDGESLAHLAVELAAKHESALPYNGSARNRLTGIVTSVTMDTVAAQVTVQAGHHRIVSLITREAVDELQLDVGMVVTATVKATDVMINAFTLPEGANHD